MVFLRYGECKLNLIPFSFFIIWKTDANPSSLDAELQRLPRSLSESLGALKEDTVITELIGEKLLVAIKGIRKVCHQTISICGL